MPKPLNPRNPGKPANKPPAPAMHKRDAALSQQTGTIFHSGPLPDPATMEYYNKLIPDAAERLLTLVETQAAHRQAREANEDKLKSRNSLWGMILAFLLGLTSIVGGVAAIVLANPLAGVAVSGLGIAGLVGVHAIGAYIRR